MIKQVFAIVMGVGLMPCLASAQVDFSGDPEAAALAERVLEPDLKDAREVQSSIFIQAVRMDLNGDDVPEIIGQLHNVFMCGGMGPCFFVIQARGDSHVQVFSVPGVDVVDVLASSTNGWRDLALTSFDGETRWQWDGATYDLVQP